MNPLETAINLAVRTNSEIDGLFAHIGTSRHPNGSVLVAYRTARMAMQSALQITNKVSRRRAVNDVLSTLTGAIKSTASDLAAKAVAGGVINAQKQLNIYGEQYDQVNLGAIMPAPINAIITRVDAQVSYVKALAETSDGYAMILGDG